MAEKKKYEDFFYEYLDRGFGKVKASDLEVMIFHWYLEKRKKDNVEQASPLKLSLELSIPISKVKDLLYKENLVYEDHSLENLKEKVRNLKLKQASFEGDGKWILIITDKFVREYVTDYLLTNNHSVKSDFIRDNIVIDYNGFISLCEYVYENGKVSFEEIKTKTINDLVKEFGKGVLSEFTNSIVSKSLFDVIEAIKFKFFENTSDD